ncbi:MAG: alcohol dehydrogenase catalytic domain-containing protein, partial [Actinobacteria bacterium]|nr:alcohol dehydrogenase catalytic domain-containing protein [Actinomycetota bacterium]
MRSAVLTGPGAVDVVDVAPAELTPGSVRVAVDGCGVCGSNLPVWEGRPWFDYPLAPGNPGHEAWGRVVDGPGAGQRVALLAENAFTAELVVPADRVVPLPAELDGQPFPGEALG